MSAAAGLSKLQSWQPKRLVGVVVSSRKENFGCIVLYTVFFPTVFHLYFFTVQWFFVLQILPVFETTRREARVVALTLLALVLSLVGLGPA